MRAPSTRRSNELRSESYIARPQIIQSITISNVTSTCRYIKHVYMSGA